MSGLQFMNQDGEWENFPTDDELAEKAKHQELLNAFKCGLSVIYVMSQFHARSWRSG